MFFKANIPKKIWQSAHGGINRIQFQNNPEACLKDNYTALGCICVLTSNGNVGTLTHLDTEVDLQEFINCLDDDLDADKMTSEVILAGGNNKRESKEFLKKLRRILTQNDYHIIGEETGGPVLTRRITSLYRNEVEVTKTNRDISITTVPFKFPLDYLPQLFSNYTS